MFLYETHLHTFPVSRCAHSSVRENLEFYKDAGYAGVFITNHFLDGNINIDHRLPYEERIQFYFSDYEEALRIGSEIGLSVFLGVELSYEGTDFLIYGLDKQWFLAHPEIMEMQKSDELKLMADSGALVIQAHPFRAAHYIDHVRLYPARVHGVETYNGCNTELENTMAEQYAKHYELIPFAGTDNHFAGGQERFGGMRTDSPITDVQDFIDRVKSGCAVPFRREMGGTDDNI